MTTANDIVAKLKSGELENPSLLSDYLIILSASMNTGGQMELEAEIDFARKWQEFRPDCKSDKECDMKTKLTGEYSILQRARIANKTILSCIQSLKKKLQNLSDELKSAQNY